jgi:putative spermidine/putrescine transport system substrate-binding protein
MVMQKPSRRSVLVGAGASLATGPFFHVTPAAADKGRVTVAGWGGARAAAMRAALFDPFERATGIRVIEHGPPDAAKVKAMVHGGNITWDILETDTPAILTMTKGGLLEKIDYSRLDRSKLESIPEALKQPYGLGHLIYSFNIVYNTNTFFSTGKHPQSWADVWDGTKFKGGRSFPYGGGISPQLEMAVIADGVPIHAIYPLDVERAWRSMDRLRPLVTKWYSSHHQAIDLLARGEVDICCTIGPRGIAAKRAGAPIGVEYNQGKLAPSSYAIVKGASDIDATYQFLDFAMDGKVQAELARRIPYGPSSRAAFDHLTEAEAKDLNTSPENIERQFWNNTAWWGADRHDGKTHYEAHIEHHGEWMKRR